MKRILNVLILILLGSGVIFLFVFANLRQKDITCSSFEIEIDYNGAPPLINKSTIKRSITQSGIRIKDQLIEDLPIQKLKKLLNSNPYIKKAIISVSVNGVVKASIHQRNPLVRIMDKENNECLLDTEGNIMPVNYEFPVRLVFANGNIGNIKSVKPSTKNKDKIQKFNRYKPNDEKKVTLPTDLNYIFKTATVLNSDSLTAALVEQIFINQQKEIELIPKIGNQSIVLGDTTQISEKLYNLKVFYQQGIKNFAWNNYKVINLKYKNQVVCSKY